MSKYRNGGNPDLNQKDIVKELRKIGCKVTITSEVSDFCDLVVGFKGNLYLVEVKDGTKPPSARKLTPGEIKCKMEFHAVGVQYHVVTSVQDALKLIGVK